MGFPAYRNPTLECCFIDHESSPKFAVIDAQTAFHRSDGRMKETMSIKRRQKKKKRRYCTCFCLNGGQLETNRAFFLKVSILWFGLLTLLIEPVKFNKPKGCEAVNTAFSL